MLWQTQQIDNVKLSLIFLLLLVVPVVFASCSGNQIDINSASAEELDKIIWVGPATATKIINARMFESVDELIEVSGIGEVKLADIKEQGLACVSEEDEEKEDKESGEEEKDNDKIKKIVYEVEEKFENLEEEVQEEAVVIQLNAQTIKSEENKKVLDKGKYARYGFVVFCALLVFLFVIKARKNKNEFRD